jgi:hypothetical protein
MALLTGLVNDRNKVRYGSKSCREQVQQKSAIESRLFDHLGWRTAGAAVAQTRLRLFEDAEQLIAAWNERHAAIAASSWFA